MSCLVEPNILHHKALGNHSASLRDYKKYLNSAPPPSDASAVEAEMNEVLRDKADGDRFEKFAPGWTGSNDRSTRSSEYSRQSNRKSWEREPACSSGRTPPRQEKKVSL